MRCPHPSRSAPTSPRPVLGAQRASAPMGEVNCAESEGVPERALPSAVLHSDDGAPGKQLVPSADGSRRSRFDWSPHRPGSNARSRRASRLTSRGCAAHTPIGPLARPGCERMCAGSVSPALFPARLFHRAAPCRRWLFWRSTDRARRADHRRASQTQMAPDATLAEPQARRHTDAGLAVAGWARTCAAPANDIAMPSQRVSLAGA
jgi:hypothetical protein